MVQEGIDYKRVALIFWSDETPLYFDYSGGYMTI